MRHYLRYKDKQLRLQFKQKYFNRILLKSFLSNERILILKKIKIMLKLQNDLNLNYKSKIKSRSNLSNDSRSVWKLFNFSKSDFQDFVKKGKINGFKKAVW